MSIYLVDEKFLESCVEVGHTFGEIKSEAGIVVARQCSRCLRSERIKIRTCERCKFETRSFKRIRNRFCKNCRGRKSNAAA